MSGWQLGYPFGDIDENAVLNYNITLTKSIPNLTKIFILDALFGCPSNEFSFFHETGRKKWSQICESFNLVGGFEHTLPFPYPHPHDLPRYFPFIANNIRLQTTLLC